MSEGDTPGRVLRTGRTVARVVGVWAFVTAPTASTSTVATSIASSGESKMPPLTTPSRAYASAQRNVASRDAGSSRRQG